MLNIEKINLLSLFVEPNLLWASLAFFTALSLGSSYLLWHHKVKIHQTKQVTNLEIIYACLWIVIFVSLLFIIQSYSYAL
jgi:hypothetical protein